MTAFMRLAHYCLDDGTRDLLGKELTEHVAVVTLDSDSDEAILASIGAHALQRYLPGEILHAIGVFRAAGTHVLMLRNLPVQELPPTPVSGFGAEPRLALTNALHFGLIQLLGTVPFSVGYENSGRLIRNVVPNPQASGTTSSWGADAEFFWHTDNPHLPFGGAGTDPRPHVPRYLTFTTLRNDEGVSTDMAAADDAVALLDAASREELAAARFAVGAPASNDAGPPELAGAAVLERSPESTWWARYDRGTTRAATPAGTAALDSWAVALRAAHRIEHVLAPGDFVIFDNYRVLHRRRAFTPAPAARARWLRRCYAS
jgi:hypothetical protein